MQLSIFKISEFSKKLPILKLLRRYFTRIWATCFYKEIFFVFPSQIDLAIISCLIFVVFTRSRHPGAGIGLFLALFLQFSTRKNSLVYLTGVFPGR